MTSNRTFLLLDDEVAVLELYLAILLPAGRRPASGTLASPAVFAADAGPLAGLDILVARSVEEAAQLAQQSFEAGRRLVGGLFDLKLRGSETGLDAIRRVRELDAEALVTVVTGYRGCTLEEIEKTFAPEQADEWDYLAKPFSRWEIQRKCRQMVESWDRRRREQAQVVEIRRLNDELTSSSAELERRVAERTRQLASANETLAERNARLTDVLEDLSRTQAELVHHERMASLFGLAAGVAEQVSRPLRFVRESLGSLSRAVDVLVSCADRVAAEARPMPEGSEAVAGLRRRLRRALDETGTAGALDDARGLVDGCLVATGGIARTMDALRSFARPRADLPRCVDVGDGLRAAVAALPEDLLRRGRVELDVGPVPPVVAHADELQQVWTALVTNALQALPDGPPRSGRAAGAGQGEPCVRARVSAGDGAVVVAIEDEGPGVMPEVVQRVFEPFFTSHAGGEHVGLGLSVSYGIIERHGGTIEIENLPAGGACVTVRLPSAFVGRDTLAVARA